MKAIRLHDYGTPESLVIEDVPVPEIKGNEVLVKVHAASVNPIDWKKGSGAMKEIFPVHFPWIPGEDFAGTIAAIGKEVHDFKVGDEVYGDTGHGGAYAEYVAVKPGIIAKKPTALSFSEAASVPVVAETAWQGLFKYAKLEKGQTILIHGGAGAVGAYAVQFAHLIGAKVFVTASATDQDFLKSIGADQVLDYKTTRFEEELSDIDVVFDLVGGDNQLRSFKVMKPGGILVASTQPIDEEQAVRHQVTGVFMDMKPSREGLNRIAELLDNGELRTTIANTYPLEQASSGWNDIAGRHSNPAASTVPKEKSRNGKTVLQVI
ncbi:NADP-dependent oxidoreductase [Pedobacter steynii]|uniref:Enoyl reductase (ER) domain-containing protein n=1 Tax=Pedobacter steynii TaxID=430522 RepID=A0A1D7QKG1_9SPHI|nr:NADP-dependent oxidoreductase [Pedobacter steynii]AOM79158.1 hypothetical protein BFS30_19480 [Pedobacter steynii]